VPRLSRPNIPLFSECVAAKEALFSSETSVIIYVSKQHNVKDTVIVTRTVFRNPGSLMLMTVLGTNYTGAIVRVRE
jgi:hypothetical protein